MARATLQVSRLNEGQTGVRRASVWHCESEGLDEFRRLADRAGVRPRGRKRALFQSEQVGNDIGAILWFGQSFEKHLHAMNVAAGIGKVGIQ